MGTAMWTRICLCLAVYSVSKVSGGRHKRSEVIKVTTIEEPPYLTVKDSKAQGNAKFEGFIPDLMEKIGKETNIKYELKLVEDGRYGFRQSNGEWNGMIGEVIHNRAKMAAAPITLSPERKQVVAFTDPVMALSTTILIYKPPDGSDPPIKNAQELADSDIQYGVIKDGMTQSFFKSATDELHQKMWRYMNNHKEVLMDNVKDAVDKVRKSNGKFAFIMENTTAAYWIHKQPCDLMTVGEPISVSHYGLVTQKTDTQLKNRLNTAISDLKSKGVIHKLEKKWWKEDQCDAATSIFISYNLIISSALLILYSLL